MGNLKQRLSNREVTIGADIAVPWVQAVEAAGYAGYDFIVIDTEHGAITASQAEAMILAARAVNITAIWRVSGVERGEIKRALDWGADGILVPEIRTAEEAEAVVEAAKYPPRGRRVWPLPLPFAPPRRLSRDHRRYAGLPAWGRPVHRRPHAHRAGCAKVMPMAWSTNPHPYRTRTAGLLCLAPAPA